MGSGETFQSPITHRGSLRWKYWSVGGFLMLAAFAAVFPKGESLNYLYLMLFCAMAIALALYVCREMWMLKTKRSPRWVGYVSAFGSGGVVLALLVLHDTKLFIWNHLYFEIPIALFCAITAVGAWITEWRKSVRVLVELEGVAFVPTGEPANNTPHPDARETPRYENEGGARAGGRER